ncbi:MAG: hypothetical protein AAF289_14810 [Cyanobacteria bacterium P01_A01_bin.135]
MSVESIALIGVLTLFTVILGTDLFLLLANVPVVGASLGNLPMPEITALLRQGAVWQLPFISVALLAGAIALNIANHTRTEVYLLRIGLASLVIYMGIVLLGAVPTNNRINTVLEMGSTLDKGLFRTPWIWLLWPRVLVALASFWAFLHYAMNPKL